MSSVEHFATTPQDVQGLGAVVATDTTYGLAAPVDVQAKFDALKALIEVHVKCAAGMRRCRIEIASDQAMTTNFKQFPGDGARQHMSGLAAGTWWVRAAHVRAAELSSYTGPVAVIVK
jgi:hypothetical protein